MKKFKDIFNTFTVFKTKIIDIINGENNNPYYLNDNTFEYKQENVYNQLIRAYGEETHIYNDDDVFINVFIYAYQDSFMTFYNKVNTNKSLELSKISKAFYIALNKHTATNENESNSKMDNVSSAVPNKKLFDELLDDLQVNEADRALSLTTNLSKTDDISQIENNYRVYKQNQTSLYRVEITAFLDSFTNMFAHIVNYSSSSSSNDEVSFLTGELVEDVPYLGLENQKDINDLEVATQQLLARVVALGVPKKVYNDKTGVYEDLSDINVNLFKGSENIAYTNLANEFKDTQTINTSKRTMITLKDGTDNIL